VSVIGYCIGLGLYPAIELGIVAYVLYYVIRAMKG